MEWLFNGKCGNKEVYEFVTGGIANVFLEIRDGEKALYQIYYSGSCKEGTVDFSNCLPSRRVDFCKEAVEEKFRNMVVEKYETEKRNLDAIDKYMNLKVQEQLQNADYSDGDILR